MNKVVLGQMDIFGNTIGNNKRIPGICPICGKPAHRGWWTCKKCAKLPIDKYIEYMVIFFS